MARANLIDVGRPSRDHFLAFGRFDPFSALGCVLRTASVSIERSSAFLFDGSRVKLDFCHWVTVTMWGCPREK
jgi:hypothetical protein